MELLQEFIINLMEMNPLLQHLGIALIGVIPFLEGFFGAFVGSFIGVSAITSALASFVGNWISVMLVILPFNALFTWLRNRNSGKSGGFIQGRAKKAQETYDKYGVPGLAIIAPAVASGHIAAFISLAAGADKKRVIFWHTISILLWVIIGAAFGGFVGFN
ncbi:small multi-drug export protein [Geomicrobium sp. JCM 19038]|uniref:small multi-drug export protein n=1 Tax=Geomicrobium sp. JCM 19038 TaxID=1460635 RepID=UPI00045F3E06|nr:small multi-drug export protein [Geomicrobium sp. JCM 19038]GAK08713.1 hypothetical protein JCM19038_2503 [Geomicrobium sp. JCM 19038]